MEGVLKKSILSVAIIGFGPKGLYALERLIANLVFIKNYKNVEIHIYNNTSFLGSGDVYRTDQPAYLLMNYANCKIGFKNTELPELNLPDFKEFIPWLASRSNKTPEELKYQYSARKTIGKYLEYCFSKLLEALPQNVNVIQHIATVIDIIPENSDYQIITECENEQSKVQEILLTTGHFWNRQKIIPSKKTPNYVEFIYPVMQNLQNITNKDCIAIKGIGLTFIDAVLELTQGREGRFERIDNTCKYVPSGKEPKAIFPYSRTGLPMIPKTGKPDSERELRFFNEEFVDNLLQKKSVSFQNDILPALEKESKFIYYQTYFEQYNLNFQGFDDTLQFELQIENFHKQFQETDFFDWNNLINPFQRKKLLTNQDILQYIDAYCDSAEQKKGISPWLEVISMWRTISTLFSKIYNFGGLTAFSQKEFDFYYFKLLNRLAYGPPVENMRKIQALVEANILDFRYARGAQIKKNEKDGFSIHNSQFTNAIDIHINATIPRSLGKEKKSGLFGNLLARGIISEFINKNEGEYATGAVLINEKGRVIDAKGNTNTHISCYGTPTEGITFDNDTLSNTKNNFSIYWAKQIAWQTQQK